MAADLQRDRGRAWRAAPDETEILDALRRRWPRCRLLLTLGSRGCVYDDGLRRLRQGIYRTRTVDTTAAGDTFTGYFVACMAQGRPEEECLDLASRAGGHRRVPSRRGAVYSGDSRGALVLPSAGGVLKSKNAAAFGLQHFSRFPGRCGIQSRASNS